MFRNYFPAQHLVKTTRRCLWKNKNTAAVIIALATISSQALKAALANPVKSLRTE
jgi:hypothetical protein